MNIDWCPVIENYGQLRALAVAQEPTAHRGSQLHRGRLGDQADGERLTTQGESIGKVCNLAVGEDFQVIHFVID